MSEKEEKKKKEKSWIKFAGCLGGLVGIFAFIVYLLYFTDVFVLKKIRVVGAHKVNKNYIIASTGLRGGERLFRIPLKNIKAKILKDTRIKDVTLIRHIPDTLEIIVKERKPIAILKEKGGLYLIDADGVKITKASPSDNDLYPIITIKDYKNEKELLRFLKWLKNNNRYLPVFENIKKVVLDSDELVMKTKDGFSIYFPISSKKDWIYFYRNLDRIMLYLYAKHLEKKIRAIRFDYPRGEALIQFRGKENG